jgi:hypothetical protein
MLVVILWLEVSFLDTGMLELIIPVQAVTAGAATAFQQVPHLVLVPWHPL